ncbi:MAG: hypothetical protein JWM31_3500, partial [Solirubrobacterales bacterium]|nr:hypothetical protein [Solirubrobacterales bacterium]
MRRRLGRLALGSLIGAAAMSAAPPASAATREFWVAAVPVTWNAVPNQRDAIEDVRHDPSETIFPTTVYRRFSRHWRRPLANTPFSGNQDLIPGPLLRAAVGDRLVVHFKNLDARQPHSMHFHGVGYRPDSDGSYVPGVSGRDADVGPGQVWTYRLAAGPQSAGVWPYHDHSPSMH